MKIYAPTHIQRSLCVFGCNRAACSLRPEGWRVIRTQKPSPADPPQDEAGRAKPMADNNNSSALGGAGRGEMPPTPPVPVPAVVEPAPDDAWGASGVSWEDAAAASPDGDGWGAEASEWGAGTGTEGAGEEATPDIGALLDEQEKRSSKAAQGDRAAAALAPAPAPPPGAPASSQGGGACYQSTPAEPQPNGDSSDGQRCPAGGASGAEDASVVAVASVEAENGAGGIPRFPAKAVSFMPEPWGAGSSGADDKDMENRLRRYREQEEDRGLVAALDQALGLKKKDGGATGDGGGRQGGGGGGGGVASIGEKYERTPAR